jgi:hypothetical protein
LKLVTDVEAAQFGVPQTAVECLCPTCDSRFAVALEENDRRLLAGEPAPDCPDCRVLVEMHFPEP